LFINYSLTSLLECFN